MIINNRENNNGRVKFISYTGRYPNLCRGILTVEIDGEKVIFDPSYFAFCDEYKGEDKLPELYGSFWDSGGECGFKNNYFESYVYPGEWIIDRDRLPEKYKDLVEEFDRIFNDNVPFGCCGGCL